MYYWVQVTHVVSIRHFTQGKGRDNKGEIHLTLFWVFVLGFVFVLCGFFGGVVLFFFGIAVLV